MKKALEGNTKQIVAEIKKWFVKKTPIKHKFEPEKEDVWILEVYTVAMAVMAVAVTVHVVLHWVSTPSQYDVNRDGAVNITDVSTLVTYIDSQNYGHKVGTPYQRW